MTTDFNSKTQIFQDGQVQSDGVLITNQVVLCALQSNAVRERADAVMRV
jgi:hypothetical protein